MNTTMTENILPHSAEAEEATIGGLLIDPNQIHHLTYLKEEHFYIGKNRQTFQAMRQLMETKKPIDLITVMEKLRQNGYMEEEDSPGISEAEIISLINVVPTSVNTSAYAQIVHELAIKRLLIHGAQEIATRAFAPDTELSTLKDFAQQVILEATVKDGQNVITNISDVLMKVYDNYIANKERGEKLFGIPTGLKQLDRILSGLIAPDLTVVGARPGMGKTALISQMIAHGCRLTGKRAAVFSLEMSDEQLTTRLIADAMTAAGQPTTTKDIRQNQLTPDQENAMMEAIGSLSQLKIHLCDVPSLTHEQVGSHCRRILYEHGELDIVVIDYLGLMKTNRYIPVKTHEISEITRGLKNLCRELNITIILAAQLSRGLESRQDKRPMLSDLRDSGSIEQDADNVLFIYRDRYYDEDSPVGDQAEIIVAKHRNGELGTAYLRWSGKRTRFLNMDETETFTQIVF